MTEAGDGERTTDDGEYDDVNKFDEGDEYCCLCGTHTVWEHEYVYNYITNTDFVVEPAPTYLAGVGQYAVTSRRRCDDDKCGCTQSDKCIHRGRELTCEVCGRTGHDKHACWTNKPWLDVKYVAPKKVLKKAPKNAHLRQTPKASRGVQREKLKPLRARGSGKVPPGSKLFR